MRFLWDGIDFNTIPNCESVEQENAINALLRQFGRAACAATGPAVEAYVKSEVARKILPWCLNEANALALAYQLPVIKTLIQTYNYPFGLYGTTVPIIKQAIARADEILSENLLWNPPDSSSVK